MKVANIMYDEQHLLVHQERQQDMLRYAENKRMARQYKTISKPGLRHALGRNLITLGQQLLQE